MLCPPKKGYTEEDYYFGEWTAAERENGEHLTVVKFVRLKLNYPRLVLLPSLHDVPPHRSNRAEATALQLTQIE